MTNCAQHFSYYLILDLQLCVKTWEWKETSGFCRKTPLASSEASATPCFKKLSGALYLFDQRWSWCAPLSFLYFCTCMPVNRRPWQYSKRKECRPSRWDATEGYWTFCTWTMLPMRRLAERSKQPLENNNYDELLTLVLKWKLRWSGHFSKSSGLAKTLLPGTVIRKRGRSSLKKSWEDNIKICQIN